MTFEMPEPVPEGVHQSADVEFQTSDRVKYVDHVRRHDGVVDRVQRHYRLVALEGDGEVLGTVEPRGDQRDG